jgi:hypothetical protein
MMSPPFVGLNAGGRSSDDSAIKATATPARHLVELPLYAAVFARGKNLHHGKVKLIIEIMFIALATCRNIVHSYRHNDYRSN